MPTVGRLTGRVAGPSRGSSGELTQTQTKKEHTTMKRLVILPVAGLLLFAACGEDEPSKAEPAAASETAERVTTTVAEDESYTLSDFTIDLIVLEDQCFDTAGALVTVEPDVAIRGGDYDGEATLVYEIRGGENVETFNIEIKDGRYSYDQHHISTARCNATLTAVPTRLIER